MCLSLQGSHRGEALLRGCILRRFPEVLYRGELRIKFHENCSTMVSLGRRGDVLTLRLHRLFARAPEPILDRVVRMFFVERDPDVVRRLRASVVDYIESRQRKVSAEAVERVLGSARGGVYDLSRIQDWLLEHFLPECPRLRIGWSRRVTARLMGKWIATPNGAPNLIVINPLLDDPRVPLYYLKYLVYHELLHEVVPMRRVGGRWVRHSPEFQRLERAYPDFQLAVRWERENVRCLFEAHHRRGGRLVLT